ncbi:ABC transporter ATP-binding protein [Solicola sp. PLA-1-18]|uniref:ABC transporter ATP-binding protein n=1 Tax=Solicola sp. PLA-1-18 TaxID=3380532 RepID=UPI003B791B89
MKTLPLPDPGRPDLRSADRYLLWIVRSQGWRLVGAIAFGIVWMVAQALMPAVIGRAIDTGLGDDDRAGLLLWAGVLLGVGVVQAAAGVMRHRFSVGMWLDAAYRTVQLVSDQTGRLGATLRKRVATGEVVSVGANDIANVGNSVDVLGRTAGALVSFLVVAGLLLTSSVELGLLVLIGMPLLLLAIGPVLGPLQRRNAEARELQGGLNNLASDIVGGLRVLRGVGGEDVFHRRYAEESQRVRVAGVRVGRTQSLLDALQVLLPGVFVVLVVWLGARFAAEGRISAGELIAFYGYSTFLLLPLRTATEFANKIIRARVASGRVVRILVLEPEHLDPHDPVAEPRGGELVDHRAGFVAREGELTVVVADEPQVASDLADRLGRFAPGDVTLDGVALDALPLDVVRRRVVVHDTQSMLFSGDLRVGLDVREHADDAQVHAAVEAASAQDVVDGLRGGLHAEVEERGRSFSGGQRQRLALARALLTDADVLVLVEPTSAVDAHTEARIAATLKQHRAGRTTVVVSSSPLVLDVADVVAFVSDGQVVASGTHHGLREDSAAYRAVVDRQDEEVRA